MRNVGERSFSALQQARKSRKELRIRNIEVQCSECGYMTKFSHNGKRNLDEYKDGKWKCQECKEKDRKELQQAILNLAKNKLALKKKGAKK